MPSVVVLRHGESTWNRLNLFTGWHDVPLSEAGEAEARRGRRGPRGRRASGSTSSTPRCSSAPLTPPTWRSAVLGQPWLPVERSWRLNERHYGALQGLNKKETTERHGAVQTKLWRRSYDVPAATGGPG